MKTPATPAQETTRLAETLRHDITAGGWKSLDFEPFRPGVTIHWIRRFEGDQPGIALLKYQPGASVPHHVHEGTETILVLEGSQCDESGAHAAGTFIVNGTGTRHSVRSAGGCVVLIHWDRPVRILEG